MYHRNLPFSLNFINLESIHNYKSIDITSYYYVNNFQIMCIEPAQLMSYLTFLIIMLFAQIKQVNSTLRTLLLINNVNQYLSR